MYLPEEGICLDLKAATRELGNRVFIFEGALQKAKSGRKLYCYLFNDLILLTDYRKDAIMELYRKVNQFAFNLI